MTVRAHFDPAWYLQAYPDVARAGMDPWEHYSRYGRHEGRQPAPNRAMSWAHHLWRGGEQVMPARLARLLEDATASDHERCTALLTLLIWHAASGRWEVVECLAEVYASTLAPAMAPGDFGRLCLVRLQAICARNRLPAQYRHWLALLRGRQPDWPDTALATANLALVEQGDGLDADNAWLQALNTLYDARQLCRLALQDSPRSRLDRLWMPGTGPRRRPWWHVRRRARVSIIVPLYNAGTSIETALRSLEAQTWPDLEVIVVNDASRDDGAAIAETFCAAARQRTPTGCRRSWRVLHHPHNRGAYAARNTGMAAATGEFLTVHDADDWAHSQKIARQVCALQEHPERVGSLSHWVRVRENGEFGREQMEEGWVHRNVSSLMIRKAVLKRLGYWDEVRVNADTEYYYRLLAAYGEQALIEVLPGVPLSFGRHNPQSLTQQQATHISSRNVGARALYMDAARRWHQRAAASNAWYLPREPAWRPFPAPAALLLRPLPLAGPMDDQDRVQGSGLFDPRWYLETQPDLHGHSIEPFAHWWRYGVREGRDPGPEFSVSGYALAAGLNPEDVNPLAHFLQQEATTPSLARPLLPGHCPERTGRPWMLVCGHQASIQLYGAERSLLDVLDALGANDLNLQVVLPSAVNSDYVQAVRARAQAIVIMPLPWWREGRTPWQPVRDFLHAQLRSRPFRWVYLNTVVHYEAALAARDLSIPVWMHVREMPEADPALCELLGATPAQVRRHVLSLADGVIANSQAVAGYYRVPRCRVIPNVIRADALADMPLPGRPRLQLAMISSNLPKKGVADFATLAQALKDDPVDCVLIGPENEYTGALVAAGVPVCVAGYAATPAQALAQADVVVNLSHFEESFGRTVLEAMAAGRPVVAYQWGALPELIVDGETGYLVAKGDVGGVAECIRRLIADPQQRERMGVQAQNRARTRYSPAAMRQSFQECGFN